MKIKAIIFDLDDTLFDCTNTLVDSARRRAAKSMVNAGMKCSEKDAYNKMKELIEQKGPKINVFDRVAEFYGSNKEKIVNGGINAYNSPEEIEDINLFPNVKNVLSILRKKHKIILVTSGIRERQEKKLDILGLKSSFDLILIDDISEKLSKEDRFLAAIRNFKLNPNEVMVVGDRIFSEIRIGNMLGMTTIQMMHGMYSSLVPTKGLETPDFRIQKIEEIKRVLNKLSRMKSPKIVVLGGGTGLPSLLEGLKKYTRDLTAVVAVTDSGRSSGMLRKDFDIAPPGDIRNCLVALSDAEKLMADMFQYRFSNGSLEGHSFGNLLITTLTKVTGSFEKAIHEVGKILNIQGKVLPSSHENVHINAEFMDGSIIEEEDNIIDRHNDKIHLRPRIKRVFLSKKVKVCKEAVDDILGADVIVLGPGGLFTSVISNLLVKGIKDAVVNSKAKKVYVCNIMVQPSQTYGFTASDHVKEIINYLGKDILDYIVLNTKTPPKELLRVYEKEHSPMIKIDDAELDKFKAKKIKSNIVEDIKEIEVLWNKRNLLRHDSNKIAKILIDLA